MAKAPITLEQIRQQDEEQYQKPEPKKVVVQNQEHSEACYLAFTTVYYNGVEWHLTMREGVTGKNIVEFLENLGKTTDWIEKQEKWGFTRNAGQAPRQTKKQTVPAPKRAAATRPTAPTPPSTAAPSSLAPSPSTLGATSLPLATSSGAAVGDVIDVKIMSRHMSDDGEREYYRVKGGRYMKFGVRCWPEVAETLNAFSIEAASMTLGQSYNLADFNLVAQFVRNDEGKVSKVVEFSKKEQ